jgi:hypothetical protein
MNQVLERASFRNVGNGRIRPKVGRTLRKQELRAPARPFLHILLESVNYHQLYKG